MIIQILICLLIYFIFYLIETTNYVFSASTINKTKEILEYDMDIKGIYTEIKNNFINEENNNIQENSNMEENVVNEEIVEEEKKEDSSNEETTNIDEAKNDEKNNVEENNKEEIQQENITKNL